MSEEVIYPEETPPLRKASTMICPVCHHQMIKVRLKPEDVLPNSIKCIRCNFVIYYKGVKAA